MPRGAPGGGMMEGGGGKEERKQRSHHKKAMRLDPHAVTAAGQTTTQ